MVVVQIGGQRQQWNKQQLPPCYFVLKSKTRGFSPALLNVAGEGGGDLVLDLSKHCIL